MISKKFSFFVKKLVAKSREKKKKVDINFICSFLSEDAEQNVETCQKSLKQLTVNSPVMASKPTCTVCSKLVGYEMFGFESVWDGFEPFILFFKFFFFLSGSSGSETRKF